MKLLKEVVKRMEKINDWKNVDPELSSADVDAVKMVYSSVWLCSIPGCALRRCRRADSCELSSLHGLAG